MKPGRAWRGTAAVLLALLGLAQFVRRPSLENPPLTAGRPLEAHLAVPPDVDRILRRACYDCHSHETRWPIYAWVAPVSWLVARDVRAGRSDLNFSDWSTDPDREPTPTQRLGGICSDLRRRIMPPRSYLVMHPRARLSPADRERVCQWTVEARGSTSSQE